MRHTYKLSAETIKVLKPNVEPIAREWGVSDKHVYAILAGSVTDHFSAFLNGQYTAALRAGVSVAPWITALMLAEEKYRPLAKDLCVVRETQAFMKEANDVAMAHIADEDLHRILDEQVEANARGEAAARALRQAIEQRNLQVLRTSNAVPFANRKAS